MRATLILAATVAVGNWSAAADAPAKAPEGLWRPTSMVYEGKEMADAEAKEKMTLVLKDGEYRMFWTTDAAKDEGVRLFTGDVSFDPAKGTFEVAIKDGQKKGEKVHGIYQLKDGVLRLCYGPAEKARPAAFASQEGSGYFCESWTAVKK
jgi:uncharacterized protein (TIGR03067 family)